ncbi:hypothetical protein [Haloglycomyces albus]|uniref:hypothetical protein n=1 Tax=Haloglycomyces albus TaxID=526067 RepID=UPI00046CABD6|nr:hypothetical protein [Haloglycomyces albus]
MQKNLTAASTIVASLTVATAGTLAMTAGTAMAAPEGAEESGGFRLVKIEQDKFDMPTFCGLQNYGAPADPACDDQRYLGDELAERRQSAEAETPASGALSLVNVDARNAGQIQVCGINIATDKPVDNQNCDNSIPASEEPVGGDSGIALATIDLRGAGKINVCGVSVLGSEPTDCAQ